MATGNIDAQAVAEMLLDAGAPSVPDIEKLAPLADFISRIPAEIERRDREAEYAKLTTVYDRANKAASDLRRFLLEIADREDKVAAHFNWPDHKESADRLRAWVETIPDIAELPSAHSFEPQHPSFYSPTKLWQGQAFRLFNAYKEICGPCGIWNSGPAARFILAVFKRLNVYKHVTGNAVEKEVSKLAKEFSAAE